MGHEVNLTELPRDGFGFICREMITRIRGHNEMLAGFYERFDITRNLKQLQVWQTFMDPMLPVRTNNRVQYVCMRGSVGSGKSIMGIALPLALLHRYPGASWLGMRRTDPSMMASMFDAICKFCTKYDIPFKSRLKSSTGPATITFPNGSKWVFWSSESVVESADADNARGLGSMEFSGATIEEADTVHWEAIQTVPQRLREPSGLSPRIMFLVLNPTADTHPLAKMFREAHKHQYPEDYHDFKFTMQDNAYWSVPGYIEGQIARFKPFPGLYRRFILGEWGPEVKGDPIFGKYYDENFHVSKTSFVDRWYKDQLWQDGDVCLCWDFGYEHPALVVFQDVKRGDFKQIRILYCHLGDNVDLGTFAEHVLAEVKELLPGATYRTYVDPAGKQRDGRGVSKINALDVLRKFHLHPIATHADESAAIQLIIDLLKNTTKHKVLGTQPQIIIEKNDKYTRDIKDMFELGYVQDPKPGKKDVLKPYHDKYYIHLGDALRYGIINRRQLLRPGTSDTNTRPGYETRYTLDRNTGMYLPEAEEMDVDFDLSAYYGFGNGAYEKWN